MKKLILAGGSGFLGKELTHYLKNDFDEIIILSRQKNSSNGNVKHIHWDAKNFGNWTLELEGATAIINLCGKSVDCRYTQKNKDEILSSRIDSTSIIGKAVKKCVIPPKVWINGASATIYAQSENKPMTEKDGIIGTGFSIDICNAWENTFNSFTFTNTKMVNLRISMVMGNSGGVYPTLKKIIKQGLGGTMGKGTQLVSWIHITDFCEIVKQMIDNKNLSGIYNVVTPNPISNNEMMKILRKKCNVTFGLPATEWMLEIGAFFIRTETELILKSRYSYPENLLNAGFTFKYNTFNEALNQL